MPANGATIRGHPGPHISRSGLVYNPETGIYIRETEYSGSQQGIAGLASSLRDNNREHRLDYQEGISRVTVYEPTQGARVLDKYEILWEMEQRSIWNHPSVKTEAKAYDDALVTAGDQTFRDIAEDAVSGKIGISPTGLMAQVIAHLRAGVDSWEQEYVVLRRTRTVPPNLTTACNIAAASLIYTTAQLLLPGDVLFSLPDITAMVEPDSTNFRWGWRRRPSTSTIQGQSNEQTSEFILAAWSLLFYSPSTENADW